MPNRAGINALRNVLPNASMLIHPGSRQIYFGTNKVDIRLGALGKTQVIPFQAVDLDRANQALAIASDASNGSVSVKNLEFVETGAMQVSIEISDSAAEAARKQIAELPGVTITPAGEVNIPTQAEYQNLIQNISIEGQGGWSLFEFEPSGMVAGDKITTDIILGSVWETSFLGTLLTGIQSELKATVIDTLTQPFHPVKLEYSFRTRYDNALLAGFLKKETLSNSMNWGGSPVSFAQTTMRRENQGIGITSFLVTHNVVIGGKATTLSFAQADHAVEGDLLELKTNVTETSPGNWGGLIELLRAGVIIDTKPVLITGVSTTFEITGINAQLTHRIDGGAGTTFDQKATFANAIGKMLAQQP